MEIVKYEELYQEKWDRFVLNNSINGTFLQTRNFLNYHPRDRFTDASLLVMQGGNIMAVIPACVVDEDGKKCFYSHKGSTFGGIVLGEDRYNISFMEDFLPFFEQYLKSNNFEMIILKNTSSLFSDRNMELLNYFLYKNSYRQYDELNFYIDMGAVPDELTSLLSGSKRRDYRYSLKYELIFKHLDKDEEIKDFYRVLCLNLIKYKRKPIHSLEELLEFKHDRLREEVDFYGVYYQGEMIAGTMLFYFEKRVLHTQYLAQNAEYAKLYPMNFMDVNLIRLARDKGFEKFSFGISTEEEGRVLNKGLALFKEGFGCDFGMNRTFIKNL